VPRYTIPFLMTVEADSYEDAFEYADDLAAGIGDQEEVSFSAEHVNQHELTYDGEQRVLFFTDKGV
jgi:ketol-acid reductoisomerase